MPRSRWSALLTVLTLSLAVAIPATATDVRPVSDSERAAVQVVASFLSKGPTAFYDELAAGSPYRALAKDDALAELEVRVGPPAGAAWTLQTVVPALQDKTAVFSVSYPSGIDETVMFDMRQEQGSWRIGDVRILAQQSPTQRIFAAPVTAAAGAVSSLPKNEPRLIILVAGLLAAVLAAAASLLGGRRRSVLRSLLAVAVTAMSIAATFAFRFDDRFSLSKTVAVSEMKSVKTSSITRLATLLPLRRAMTAGTSDLDTAFRATNAVGEARVAAELWQAQWNLLQTKSADVLQTLNTFPSPTDIPLAEILRARVCTFEGKEVDSVVAYENAVSLGPGRDALWYETGTSLSSLGYDERASAYLQRLSRMGSRDANVYYTLAVIDAASNREDDAERELRKAFQMKPVERARLVNAAVLWSVLRRPAVSSMIRLNEPGEATFASSSLASRAIALPPEATARVSGDFLDIRIGEQELAVPGGAALAPPGAVITDAGEWNRSEDRKALADVPHLLTVPRTAGSFTQPQLRLRITRAARALAEHNSWSQLLQLTDGLSPRSENVPAEVLFLRDTALLRMQRGDEARQLLGELAASPMVRRKNEPQTMVELAEMLASVDQYDPAIRLLDRAAAVHPSAWVDDRVRQLQMNKRLASSYGTLTTGHFVIHYPSDVSQKFAEQFGGIMEAELIRLQKTVPTPNFHPVVVDVLWWQDFRSTFTGSDFILGFYQGKITVPLAGAPAWMPEIVAIMTHELTHAMIAQATNEQAPHWFHEGLAKRAEMIDYHPNAFNMYEDDKLLSVSLLDAVLRGSPDPGMIQESYIESQTVIRFIEAAYGPAGIPTMLKAFRDGATTEEAIFKLTGLTMAQFDVKLHDWGRSGAKVFENPPPVHYDRVDDDMTWKRLPVPAPAARSRS
jgi:tetratricopeptide (TPR) repeat protein